VGIRETDVFFEEAGRTDRSGPSGQVRMERGRLVDSYVDAHKYLFGKRAVVYGEEDLVVAPDIRSGGSGIKPVLCASGGKSGRLESAIGRTAAGLLAEPPIAGKHGLP